MAIQTIAGLRIQASAARRLPSADEAKALRESAGITQAELAAALKVHRVTLARWESGRRPRGQLLVAYMNAIDALREELQPA